MQSEVLLITPPFTQLNTAYPATAYLKGFLEEHEVSVSHSDLSIELFTAVYSRDFLRTIFQEARELGNSFTANKGKLPWPVTEGIVVSKFGKNPHPTLPNVTVENYGIDISTKKGNIARAAFDGTVSSVITLPGQGKVVLIKHGEYFTTYTFFKEVFVSTGDKVKTKQELGTLMNEAGENSSNMHFEIWKALGQGKPVKLNPISWIYKD